MSDRGFLRHRVPGGLLEGHRAAPLPRRLESFRGQHLPRPLYGAFVIREGMCLELEPDRPAQRVYRGQDADGALLPALNRE